MKSWNLILLGFSLFLPYMGTLGWYTIINCVIVLVFCFLFLNKNLVFNKPDILLQGLWLVLFVLSCIVSILNNKPLVFNDFSDLLFFLFLIVSSVKPVYHFHRAALIIFWILGVYTVVNSIVIIITTYRIFDLSMFLAETPNFDLDYISLRAVGLNGQPGKLALFSAFSIIVFSRVRSELKLITRNTWLPFFVVLSAFNSVMSFSRIGIVITIVSFVLLSSRLKIVLFVMLLLGSSYAVNKHPEKIKLLFRSDSITKVDASSLDNRLILRREAFKVVFKNPVNFILGFGPSKICADNIVIPIRHHSLRYPDSSITLNAFRYGILSLVLSAFFFTRRYLLSIKQKKEIKYNFLIIFVILVAASLDPIFHDIKLLILLFFLSQIRQLSGDKNVGKTAA